MIVQGDMLAVLPTLAENVFDSCVTDPPYHLQSIQKRFAAKGRDEMSERYSAGPYGRHASGFMGKQWDGGDIAMRQETWAAVLRVLKPGAHLVAFGGTRTHHRIWCAIEDAGFEIRDTVMWLYGSGFPKSHNLDGDWEGWGTALKPAFEPIILARKPLDGTVAENMDAWRTGAINVGASRINPGEQVPGGGKSARGHGGVYGDGIAPDNAQPHTDGRWPANVIHDGSDGVLEAFPDAPGQIADASSSDSRKTQNVYGAMKRGNGREGEPSADRRYTEKGSTNFAALPGQRRGDSGSAARFFYCAKASKADREEGCENLPTAVGGMRSENSGQHITRRDGADPKPVHNNHPTVKPTALMRYLVRLVTPPAGMVLDPFAGSGSTGKAAMLEGFGFYGVERETEYAPIAEARIAAAQAKAVAELLS